MLKLKEFNTEQELFDFVANKIITQNTKSLNYLGENVYIKNETVQSPVGWLISTATPAVIGNNYFKLDMEFKNLRELIEQGKVEAPQYQSLIEELERCHDNSHDINELISKFYRAAVLYDLHTHNLKEVA